jgi:hypothetical protein
MKMLRSSRIMFLAALLTLIPASSFAGVFISVGFAPPVLPVYVQPPCPQPGWMWTPGYWAYGDDGYYWVPGTWVPAPYMGALWTPPYWGWSGGVYVFHPGYWGPHVGFYGGVNYGFGYMGVGFVGGEWHGHDFHYNTAVVNVNKTVIHNTYINNTVVVNHTVINNNHVAYSGGPGGIRHDPMPEERVAMNEHHVSETSFQQQHWQAARADRASYMNSNGGHPQNLAVARPMAAPAHPAQGNYRQGPPEYQNHQAMQPGNAPRGYETQPHNMNQPHPSPEYHQSPNGRPEQSHAAPENHSHPQENSKPEKEGHGHGR